MPSSAADPAAVPPPVPRPADAGTRGRPAARWRPTRLIGTAALALALSGPSHAAEPEAEPDALPVAAQQALEHGGPALEALARALGQAQASVVGVRSVMVDGARTARTLGAARQGSGVVIDGQGLVLTIGYLVLEAERVELVLEDGRVLPARVVGTDTATGFGLVRSLVPLDVAPAALGDSRSLQGADTVLFSSGGASGTGSVARLVSRGAFTAYWEYHLDDALYTAPARVDHSGAGLFNLRGELVGIGSLALRRLPGNAAGAPPASPGEPLGNLFVPVELLKPILAELRDRGLTRAGTRAWIGVNCIESDGAVTVMRVAEDSPADAAGLEHGDEILRIDGQPVDRLETLWKALWRGERPDRDVVLEIRREGERRSLTVHAVDRTATLAHAQGI